MILELDCGNTRIKWRIKDNDVIRYKGAFLTGEALEQIVIADLSPGEIKRVLVSSVLDDEYRRKIVAWSLGSFGCGK